MSSNILYYGVQPDLPSPVVLTAGPLKMIYENGFLKHINLEGNEVVNMIYYALRDQDWRTFHGTIKNEKIKSNANGFDVSYRSVVSAGKIQYVFDCQIKGNKEGKIEFSVRGESYANFKRNRIGFCVLHSVNAYAGKSLKILTADKKELDGVFPELAEPFQPFINIKTVQWEPVNGWEAVLKFDGDIFEMEDQRNWSDNTYKIYCTPLELPAPAEVKMGDTIKQKVVLNVGALKKAKVKPGPELSLSISREAEGLSLPGIGLSDSTVYNEYSDNDINLLKPLSFHHLRCDVDVTSIHEVEIEVLKKKSVLLEVPLMTALHFGTDAENEAARFIKLIKDAALNIDSFILFHKDTLASSEELISKVSRIIREAFPDVKIGAGSNQHFAQANRNRMNTEGIDFLVFPSTPQTHLTDKHVLIDNLEGAAGAVKTAHSFSGAKPVYVSPVTLLERQIFAGKEDLRYLDQLPQDVDPEQASLFAAGWTLGSIKYLSEAGTARITYFETTGWKGIMQGNDPSPLLSSFRAQAGTVFPVYFTFYWLGKNKGSKVLPVKITQPAKVSGLALQNEKDKYLFLANHTEDNLAFPVHNLRKGQVISRLNEKNAASFMKDPATFLGRSPDDPVEGNVTLMPLEIVIIKF